MAKQEQTQDPQVVIVTTKQGVELILAALVELPLKAVPGQFRNQLCVDIQKQAQEQLQPPAPPTDAPAADAPAKHSKRKKV